MPVKSYRFSIRQLFVLTVLIAVSTALVVSFGNHFLWMSRHAVIQRYPAFAKIDISTVASDRELSTCSFNGISFEVPTSLIGTARIVRNSPTEVWLAFEDATRILQIPLVPKDIRTEMASVPSELKDLSSAQLLQKSVSTNSADFSFTMSKGELRVHDWAIKTRTLLNLDAQNMDRYSQIPSDEIEAILISANPASIDSSRRLRSILFWESADRQRMGTIWFGDSRNVEAGWIDSVAKSIALVPGNRLTPTELKQLNDAELLSRIIVSSPQTNFDPSTR